MLTSDTETYTLTAKHLSVTFGASRCISASSVFLNIPSDDTLGKLGEKVKIYVNLPKIKII